MLIRFEECDFTPLGPHLRDAPVVFAELCHSIELFFQSQASRIPTRGRGSRSDQGGGTISAYQVREVRESDLKSKLTAHSCSAGTVPRKEGSWFQGL
jgi:hypothetical protein